MAEDYAIGITVDPGRAIPVTRALAAELGSAELAGDRVGKAISRGMRESGLAAERARGQVSSLLVAFGAAAGLDLAKSVTDGYTQLSNRLNTVAKDQANLNGLMEASHGIAQDTFQNWSVTGEAVVRFSNATKELGMSQRGVLDFTKSFSQAIALSGAKASEQASAIQQLGQALGSGKLAGDELKSIAENAPIVIDVIAKGMGRSRGEIKSLGAEGKLTAQVIVDAFAKAAPELDQKFGKLVPTIEQNLTLLRNEALKFFGEAGQGAGIVRGLGEAFKFVIDNFDTFARAALGVGQALVGLYVIDKIIALVRMLSLAIASNPLGALLTALVVGVALLRQFGDQLDAGHDGVTKVSDVLGVLWEDLKDLGSGIVDFLGGAWQALTSVFSDGLPGEGIEFSLKSVLTLIASFVDAATSVFGAFAKTVGILLIGIPATLGEAFIHVGKMIVGVVEDVINVVIGAVNTVRNLVDELTRTASDVARDAIRQRQGLPPEQRGPAPIGKVDLSFTNPLAGSMAAMGGRLRDAWTKEFENTGARDYISGVFERAGDRAANRPASTKEATISDVAGPKGKAIVGKDQLDAAKKLRSELEAITAASNPMIDAEMKLAKAIEVTTRAVQAGLIPWHQGVEIVFDTANKTRDAREPLEAWRRELEAETAALSLSNNERERMRDIMKATDDLRGRGLAITVEVSAAIANEVDLHRSAAAAAKYNEERQKGLQEALERIKGPTWEHNRGLEQAQQLLQDGAISAAEYAEEIRRLEEAYKSSQPKGKTAADGLRRGLQSLQEEITDVASQMETVLRNAYMGAEEALVQFVVTGKFEFKSLIDSMLGDMTRLLIRQALTSLIGSFGGGIGPQIKVGGYARGGEGVVPGTGGPDSKLFIARVTPGEHFKFTPPGQPPPTPAPAMVTAAPVTVVNVYDDSQIDQWMEKKGQGFHVNFMRRTNPAKRGESTGR